MQTKFDSQRVPPAPILNLQINAPRGFEKGEPISALVDTGSDFTIIPLEYLLSVDAPESRAAQVRGLWSDPHPITLYFVDIHFDQLTIPAAEVIGDLEEPEVILGRNVLNRLILLLDGPGLQTDTLLRRPPRL